MTDIHALLKRLVDFDGSDLYLATGAPPSAKFSGELTALSDRPFKPGEVAAIADSLMDDEQREEFHRELELNTAISPAGIGRFRLNFFIQRNEVSIVARNIQTEIPNIDKLGLPDILKEVIAAKNGLVLFVGGTGSGKSTSLAALIDYRNRLRGGHIITIEDPVEYVHQHKKCIVNQREVGVDTQSFHKALKNTLRQAPDVILIGEIRDRETMEHAVAFAETGHLAISTLHANNANQALDRIINFFPEERKHQLLQDLGNNVRAIVSQRLIPTVDGKRCAAIEILLGSHTIKQMIMKDQLSDIKEAMQKSENQGMKTFDSALYDLAMEGRITREEALKNADSANNLRLRFKLSAPVQDEEDPTELMLRGQRVKPAEEAEIELEVTMDDADTADDEDITAGDGETTSSSLDDIHAAMQAQLAARKNAGSVTADRTHATAADKPTTANSGDNVFELSLELDAEPEPEPEQSDNGDDEDELPQFGMGRIA